MAGLVTWLNDLLLRNWRIVYRSCYTCGMRDPQGCVECAIRREVCREIAGDLDRIIIFGDRMPAYVSGGTVDTGQDKCPAMLESNQPGVINISIGAELTPESLTKLVKASQHQGTGDGDFFEPDEGE